MLRNIVLSLILVGMNLVGALEVKAEEIVIKAFDYDRACNNAKDDIAKVLKNEGVLYSRQEYQIEGFDNLPNREQRQVYLLSTRNEESAINSFMDNQALHTKITSSLVTSCREVGMVDFTMAQTDWVLSYGLVEGLIIPFVCNGEPYSNSRVWGESCQ